MERHYRGRITDEGRVEWVELSPEDIEAERRLCAATGRREAERIAASLDALARQLRYEAAVFALLAERRRG